MNKTFWINVGILGGMIGLIIIGSLFIACEAEKPVLSDKEESQEVPKNAVESAEQEEKYVKISVEAAPIFFEANPESTLITKARQSDVFEQISESDDWFEINMLCGEYRYLLKDHAEIVEFSPSLPVEKIARVMWDAFGEIEERSMLEADKKYPIDKDLDKNIDYTRILEDRYKLEIFHRHNVDPANYMKILVTGAEKGWWK